MTVNPPILVFEGANRPRERVHWTGPWPPPEQLLVFDGATSGRVAHVDPNDLPPGFAETRAAMRRMGTFTEYLATRESYSQLDSSVDQQADSHVVRGALYLLALIERAERPR